MRSCVIETIALPGRIVRLTLRQRRSVALRRLVGGERRLALALGGQHIAQHGAGPVAGGFAAALAGKLHLAPERRFGSFQAARPQAENAEPASAPAHRRAPDRRPWHRPSARRRVLSSSDSAPSWRQYADLAAVELAVAVVRRLRSMCLALPRRPPASSSTVLAAASMSASKASHAPRVGAQSTPSGKRRLRLREAQRAAAPSDHGCPTAAAPRAPGPLCGGAGGRSPCRGSRPQIRPNAASVPHRAQRSSPAAHARSPACHRADLRRSSLPRFATGLPRSAPQFHDLHIALTPLTPAAE